MSSLKQIINRLNNISKKHSNIYRTYIIEIDKFDFKIKILEQLNHFDKFDDLQLLIGSLDLKTGKFTSDEFLSGIYFEVPCRLSKKKFILNQIDIDEINKERNQMMTAAFKS
ncbi:hypothetical protein DY120_07310 [Apilactobacillus micheneri]|uniref:Uncharacterized protein n=1 Tax=Apilactobacillus micheneri TaxID=1899430 RepID=A0ABY2Z0C5_9LACO|nr:hypothetical protein [Apilactobacillus micheneri]TPR23106.1 hypothetical protein DY114_07295 [Apilactobacillus micheneri]TPR24424.1 hypothetical protein DY111_07310 [Apilactobacillus micheneri]TPR29371.1 hypothetical protein DY120_07310 [Apilactobacillus micheneri]TPR34578.1 hypothetical protein DY027_07300 [Apilactobacillus micheneri]